jgi:hypothetical protein
MARRLGRELLTLRGLLFVLLGVLALAVVALVLALVVSGPSGTTPAQSQPRAPTAASTGQAGLLNEDAAPDATQPPRRPLVVLPRRPPPAEVETLDLLPSDMVIDPDLRLFLREADRMIEVLDPGTGYLGMLATQALRDEVSDLRVIVESGGTAAALADIRPVRSTTELPADARTLALLLRSILVSSTGGQLGLLNSFAGQPAITERIQQAREARALGRFIEIQRALAFGAELRNYLVLSTAIDRP